jgi:hypothetical protein
MYKDAFACLNIIHVISTIKSLQKKKTENFTSKLQIKGHFDSKVIPISRGSARHKISDFARNIRNATKNISSIYRLSFFSSQCLFLTAHT